MPTTRRVTALIANLLFAHLLWAASGFACAMSPAAEGQQGATIAGMDMSSMEMAGMDMSGATLQHSNDNTEHHHAPCESPTAPDDCESMTPCAPLALATAPESASVPERVPSFVTRLVVLAPPSLVSPPDSPPPRA
jgi:hypothetical protein